jgi:nicotinamide-nucleotide amidase
VADAPRAVVVLTGSELVRGDRVDGNGPFLARELTRLGIEPSRLLLVGDDRDELEDAVREAVQADVCVFSGGLGPTHDDRTVETLARVLGRDLIIVEELERRIEAVSRGIAERLGLPYADFVAGVRKQATLPQGGKTLGLAGTAPAVLVEHEAKVAVALPGPPGELRRLWPRFVESEAFARVLDRARPPDHSILRFFGVSESAVARALEEAGGEGPGLDATVCAHDLEIWVDLFAREGGENQAIRVTRALEERFAGELFARDERPVAALVLELCRGRGWTLATAESCTGGLVGARLTDVPGSSAAFVGSVVAYADGAKRKLLGVPEEVLVRHGAVSAESAVAMATGARAQLGTDVAVAVTGVAGPDGGTPDKPVGLVFISVDAPDRVSTERFVLPGDRDAVRARSTALALHMVRRLLTRPVTNLHAGSR